MKLYLSGMIPEEIVNSTGISPFYRGKQIFKSIASGISSIQDMTNLSKDLRNSLSEKAAVFSSAVSKKLESDDGTVKLQISLHDNNKIETVLLIDNKDRKTACISTQAGCAMSCAFCKTGTLGLKRNLEANEIVEQFLFLNNLYGPVSNIVFMGMGEPLANMKNLKKACEILHHEEGLNIGYRKMTISTCGLIENMIDFTDNWPPVRLAVSLSSADEETRKRIMPITKSNPLNKLKEALEYYYKKSGKRITLEYVLIKNINDSDDQINNLVHFTKNFQSIINLIPYNPVKDFDFKEPTEKEIESFINKLENAGLKVSKRFKKGREIQGACGQLGEV